MSDKEQIFKTITRCKSEYYLTDKDFKKIGEPDNTAPNPHYSSSAPMKLYLVDRIEAYVMQNIERVEKNKIRREKLSKAQLERHEKYLTSNISNTSEDNSCAICFNQFDPEKEKISWIDEETGDKNNELLGYEYISTEYIHIEHLKPRSGWIDAYDDIHYNMGFTTKKEVEKIINNPWTFKNVNTGKEEVNFIYRTFKELLTTKEFKTIAISFEDELLDGYTRYACLKYRKISKAMVRIYR